MLGSLFFIPSWQMKPLTLYCSIQIEQFSLCVRYVEDQKYKIREDFLTFVPVYEVTGAGLANTVLETLSILGLDLKKMRGQGYDGAATMRGQFRGVQASIKEKLPLALSPLFFT
ncbi:hypothetical protein AVEN_225696-1 [Araneus ventricosus]|uniref:DUF4371 domain-containing protein n=1 Tax=Araneus ventricosus TaxID=182803 RepID=A0A4Y2FVV9_ARAVE|nr:hypothetical protein AVEN_225696-1 [Araneus ventricosus]